MSYNPENKPAKSGRFVDEDGKVRNIVDVLGGGIPLSDKVYDPDTFPAQSGRVIGEDGHVYSLVELLLNAGGGGGGGPTHWNQVTGKPNAYPPEDHNHDERYYTRAEIDSAGYLVANTDNQTIRVQGGELQAMSLSGLQLAVAQLNTWLAGTEGNIQGQINDILLTLAALSAGMRYRGKFETKSSLDGVTIKDNGDLAVVLADESRGGVRSMYVYNDSLGMWDFIGAFEFADSFTTLTDTPNAYDDGKIVRSGSSGLYFDTIKYQEIEDKPSSTITQIDDAVSKRHDHSNKPALDIIGIIEQDGEKILTIDGIPYKPKKEPKKVLSAYLSSTITINANDYIKWNAVKPLSTIPYDSNTGLFTLTPGKSYKVIVSVMGAISNYITIHFARGTEKVKSTPYSVVYGATTVNNRGGSGVLVTTFTISEGSEGKYGILVGEIGGASSVDLFGSRTMLYIEEITDI